jgi:ferric-dicitrate binding protein FerR (iron transport regulator)
MKLEENKIIELIQKYIRNESSDHEVLMLINWLKTTDNHDTFSKSAQELWQMIDIKEASSISEQERVILKEEVSKLINKGKRQQISIQNTKYNYTTLLRFVAVLSIFFSATFAIYVNNNKAPKSIQYTQQETKHGERKEIQLKDGTKVILNAKTKIIIPSNFNEKSRLITLKGEAFFEVAHNVNKPFIIQSGEAKIKVLGTSFNVKAYELDKLMAVTVSTGKVNVGLENEELQLNLTPNQHLIINKETGDFEKKTISENNYINWKRGILYFEKEPIQEVIKVLNRKYKRRVVLLAGVGNYTISGIHDNKSLEAVVESICYTTGLSFKTVGEDIHIYDSLKTLNTRRQ